MEISEYKKYLIEKKPKTIKLNINNKEFFTRIDKIVSFMKDSGTLAITLSNGLQYGIDGTDAVLDEIADLLVTAIEVCG